MIKAKLEVGDKVAIVDYVGFSRRKRYRFATVERVTNTLAILSNGDRLERESRGGLTITGEQEEDEWKVKGASSYFDCYKKETPEIRAEANKEKALSDADAWFNSDTLTREDKLILKQLWDNRKTQTP